MWQDKIVEAIHEIRQRYSRAFNHDLKAIFSELRKQQDESGRKVVNLSRQKSLTTRWSGRSPSIVSDAKNIGHRST